MVQLPLRRSSTIAMRICPRLETQKHVSKHSILIQRVESLKCILSLDETFKHNERGDIEISWNLQLFSEVIKSLHEKHKIKRLIINIYV